VGGHPPPRRSCCCSAPCGIPTPGRRRQRRVPPSPFPGGGRVRVRARLAAALGSRGGLAAAFFVAGAAGTVAAAAAAAALVPLPGGRIAAARLAGTLAAMYNGGSVNFVAVVSAVGLKGIGAAVAADMTAIAVYLAALTPVVPQGEADSALTRATALRQNVRPVFVFLRLNSPTTGIRQRPHGRM